MADASREEGINVALSQLRCVRPAIFLERVKDIAKKRDLATTRRRIEGQLRLYCDLAQALHNDDRSKKRPISLVEWQSVSYRAGQAK